MKTKIHQWYVNKFLIKISKFFLYIEGRININDYLSDIDDRTKNKLIHILILSLISLFLFLILIILINELNIGFTFLTYLVLISYIFLYFISIFYISKKC